MSENIGNVWTITLNNEEDAALRVILKDAALAEGPEGLKVLLFRAEAPGPLTAIVDHFKQNPGDLLSLTQAAGSLGKAVKKAFTKKP